VDEAAGEYDDGIGGESWSAMSWDGLSSSADNCAGASGDGEAEAILSGREQWSPDAPFGSSDVGNGVLGGTTCVRPRSWIQKTNIVRTSYPFATFGDKAADDCASRGIRGEMLGSRLCAICRSCGAVAVTSED